MPRVKGKPNQKSSKEKELSGSDVFVADMQNIIDLHKRFPRRAITKLNSMLRADNYYSNAEYEYAIGLSVRWNNAEYERTRKRVREAFA